MRKALYLSALSVFLFFSACKKDKCNVPGDPAILPPTDTATYIQNTPWPKWIFSPWVWEDESTRQSAEQYVNDYLAHGIPVGAIILDSPWETEYNTFDWDSTRYPDPKGMVDYFHSKNVRVFMWITGIIDTNVHPLYDYAASHNYFMKTSAGASGPGIVSWWKGKGSLIDWYNPAAVTWWKGLMDKTLAIGIDGWKCDGTDYYAATSAYSPGAGANVDRLEYSHKYYQLFFDYTREKLGNDRVVTSRPIDNYDLLDAGGDLFAFSPKNMAWACWVGDQDATFDGLKAALNNMYHSSEYGYLAYGSDIGGYREDDDNPIYGRSKEVFIRWAQLGAFSPIMENGGGGEHRPWIFDDETGEIYKKLALLRVKMVPYLMATASAAYAQNKSMAHYFNKTNYSYMLGDDVFVAPVLAPNGTVTINFPAGSNWVYLYNKAQVYQGGQSQTLAFPISEYPVYVKEGSAWLNSLNP